VISIRVNDIKQYAYCPRVVFYQYCMPVNKKATWKMEQGKIAEAQIDELEKRRKLREYRLAEGASAVSRLANFEAPGAYWKTGLADRQSEWLVPGGFQDDNGEASQKPCDAAVRVCAVAGGLLSPGRYKGIRLFDSAKRCGSFRLDGRAEERDG
jgi:hypothetical protein